MSSRLSRSRGEPIGGLETYLEKPGRRGENAAKNKFRTSLRSKEIQEVVTQVILPGALPKDVIKDL